MAAPFYWVDAFAGHPFCGNAAGVCFLSGPADDETMRSLVEEMSLSEIAYLWEVDEGWRLRWFTPAKEVDLCGHATLASAHVIYESGRRPAGTPLRFETRSGPLWADGAAGRIFLDFPSIDPTPCEPPPGLTELIGPIVNCAAAQRDLLAELPSADAVRSLSFSGPELLSVTSNCLIATALSDDSAFAVISRFFAPGYGIDEDPVTGSAHCVLGPYWKPRLGLSSFRAFQASARGGTVDVEVKDGRTRLTGEAITLLRGEIVIDL